MSTFKPTRESLLRQLEDVAYSDVAGGAPLAREPAQAIKSLYAVDPFAPDAATRRSVLERAIPLDAAEERQWSVRLASPSSGPLGDEVLLPTLFGLAVRRLLRGTTSPAEVEACRADVVPYLTGLLSGMRVPSRRQGVLANELGVRALRAVRTWRAIDQIAGASRSAAGLRSATWRACVGLVPWSNDQDAAIRQFTVHVAGETGVGKELIGQAVLAATPVVPVHQNQWEAAPTEALSLAGVPADLANIELFGAEAGVATNVVKQQGLFRRNDGGIVFLDEVAELDAHAQASLLRVLDKGEVRPLGGTPSRVRVRLVTATLRDLTAECVAGRFRIDLFSRLTAVTLVVPPLRDRVEDIPAIAEALVDRLELSADYAATAKQLVGEFLDTEVAKHHSWPRNVRELAQVVNSIVLGIVPDLRRDQEASTTVLADEARVRSRSTKGLLTAEEMDRIARADLTKSELFTTYIAHARRVHGSDARVARMLDVSRNTVAKHLGKGGAR